MIRTKKMEKKTNDLVDMLDDAFQQTGSNSAQEMHLDGLSESSTSSEKMESENGYELSQLNGKSLL